MQRKMKLETGWDQGDEELGYLINVFFFYFITEPVGNHCRFEERGILPSVCCPGKGQTAAETRSSDTSQACSSVLLGKTKGMLLNSTCFEPNGVTGMAVKAVESQDVTNIEYCIAFSQSSRFKLAIVLLNALTTQLGAMSLSQPGTCH